MTVPQAPPPAARRRPSRRARPPRRRPVAGALALAALAALAAPGAVPAAHAQGTTECRTTVVGEELPSGAGPHPLIDLLGLRHAWDLSTGAGVTVAVVDSGVDATHPDLDGAVLDGSEFTLVRDEREFTRDTPAPNLDCVGHGTAMAGLIAARRGEGDRMTGIAPGARIHPVRIADGVEQATHRTLAAMIDDAADSGAQVINLSLAVVADHEVIREAVARAVDRDILVVAAAGNEANQGAGGGRMYPAAYPGVLAVGAVDAEGRPLESSNAGAWVDIAAYGHDLPVVAPGGSGYRAENGTSAAAAQVSGTAALVRARFPELTAEEVARQLTASAAPVGGARNDRTGAGIVDPFGALTRPAGPAPDEAARPAAAGGVPVQPIPDRPPLLGATMATALAVSGGLLLAMALGLFGAPAVRRAVRRGWRAGPEPGPRRGPGPGPHRPRPPAGRTAPAPPAATLDRLAGSDVPPPAPPGRSRPGARPLLPSQKRI